MTPRRALLALALLLALPPQALATPPHAPEAERARGRELLRLLIETDTTPRAGTTAAAEKLAAPAKSSFEDANDKLELCDNKIDFAAAEQLLADGKNYEAYKAFAALGDFEGAFLRADACVLAAPKNGELYHNENYNFSQTQLTVYNSSSNDSFLKLYAVNGDLVCSFYIASEKKATVRVPEGTYTLNQAYGTRWFGPEDMFGDEGAYYRQLFGDTYEFTMESEYIYEISTRDSGDGTYMNDDSTDRESF